MARSITTSLNNRSYTSHYRITGKGPRKYPRKTVPGPERKKEETGSSDDTPWKFDEFLADITPIDDISADSPTMKRTDKTSDSSESCNTVIRHSNPRVDFLLPSDLDRLDEKSCEEHKLARRGRRVRRPTKRKLESMSASSEEVEEVQRKCCQRTKPEPMSRLIKTTHQVAEDEIVESSAEAFPGLIQIRSGHCNYNTSGPFSANRHSRETFATSTVYVSYLEVEQTIYERLEQFMRHGQWSGDYTVWMYPCTGENKVDRSRLFCRRNMGAEFAVSELKRLDLVKENCFTLVYLTSQDKNMRYFVRATPVEITSLPGSGEIELRAVC